LSRQAALRLAVSAPKALLRPEVLEFQQPEAVNLHPAPLPCVQKGKLLLQRSHGFLSGA